jgi:hypothetical protein
LGPADLYTKRQRIAELARSRRGVALSTGLRWVIDLDIETSTRRVTDGVILRRERSSPVRNRMLEIGTSGSVGGRDGNIPTYPAYGILGGTMETSASFEARSAPSSYPTKTCLGRKLAGERRLICIKQPLE